MACRKGATICAQAAKEQAKRRVNLLRAMARAIAKVAKAKTMKAAKAARVLPCCMCGKSIEQWMGRPKMYCSRACKRSSPASKEAKRAAKKTRKAVARGAYAERFTPLSIFERDGWRCQICGVSTPQSRRGKQYANSPELDHVYPLSKGGAHTRLNTQCACRSCNQWKSDRVVVGQVGLFTGLVAS